MAVFSDLPPEILRIIAQLIYLDHLPRSLFRCIDPHGLPSTYPDGRLISSTQPLTQSTLHALCLTSQSCYHAAKPLLWRRLQIRLPYSFLLLLRSLGVSRLAEAYEEHYRKAKDEGKDEDVYAAGNDINRGGEDEKQSLAAKRKRNESRDLDFNAMLAAVGLARVTGESVYASEKLDLKSLGSEAEGLDLVWREEEASAQEFAQQQRYHVTLAHDDDNRDAIHRFPRILDFSTFTSQGMRRTVGEGQDARYVTPAKLLALITAVSKSLMAFGASTSMDSALTFEVLEALLIRESETITSTRHRKLRGVSIERSVEREEGARWSNRLEALDFCNCSSAHFEAALRKFVDTHLRKNVKRQTSTVIEEGLEGEENEQDVETEQEDGRGRTRARGRDSSQMPVIPGARPPSSNRRAHSTHPTDEVLFTSVERLSLCGLPFPVEIIHPFVMAFPRLTHLDLSGTRVTDELLDALGLCTDIELESLSLAKCARLTSRAITEFLVDSMPCSDLTELSIEGSIFLPPPVTPEDLLTIITTAPSMRSGRMRYLDLGACGLSDNHLKRFLPQPSLLDFGASRSPYITFETIAAFLLQQAPNVQVLELVDSCFEQTQAVPNLVRMYTALLEPCTTMPPLPISEQIRLMNLGPQQAPQANTLQTEPSSRTNLRVIGLSSTALHSVGGALGNWRVIKGSGRRGWLVDVHAGPNPEASDRDLEPTKVVDGQDDGCLSGVSQQLSSAQTRIGRGRHSWRGEPSASFEPETPPRRTSRSPSLHRQGSYDGRRSESANRLLPRRATSQSQSRSRSRQPPVIRENPLQILRDNARRDRAEETELAKEEPVQRKPHIIRFLPDGHPRVQALKYLADAQGHVPGPTGWHSKKMEVLLGLGMMGRESGQYAFVAYQAP